MRRAQVSLEMFFVLSIFILVLLWLYNYQETIKHTDTLYTQLNYIAASLAATASKTCALGVSITWNAPCVYALTDDELNGERSRDYWIKLENNNVITAYRLDRARSSKAACAFDPITQGVYPTPLYLTCANGASDGGKVCVSRSDVSGLPAFQITTGVCP